MTDTLYTLTGKVQDEQNKPVSNKMVILFYRGEEVFRDVTDEDGYFAHNSDRLRGLYDDFDMPKHLKSRVDDNKVMTTDVFRLVTRTFDNDEVRAIKVHITVKAMRPSDV